MDASSARNAGSMKEARNRIPNCARASWAGAWPLRISITSDPADLAADACGYTGFHELILLQLQAVMIPARGAVEPIRCLVRNANELALIRNSARASWIGLLFDAARDFSGGRVRAWRRDGHS